ncbi:MAG: bifunctional precorrin-2 dehydrogenase/sirohydrochlorin ferrochelatase [Desulfobacteraceae bacterium]|nr:bifunctional precorrin-2 dehydrogenase/sirohydrochlorin ferrochelatase [Desulfobacteraceae bacterium]
MEYYPVYLNLRGKKVLVVGGGAVALRKTKSLLEAKAFVKVVSPLFHEGFESINSNSNLILQLKAFEEKDVSDVFLVFSATDDRELNYIISQICETSGILCNIADNPEKSGFIVPSCIKRGDLMLAVSTGGKSPALSRKLRKDLEKEFGDEYEIFLYFLGEIRCAILEKSRGNPDNRDIFREMVFGNLLKSIKNKDIEGIENELREILDSRDLAEVLMDKLLEEKNEYFFDVERNSFSFLSKESDL